MRWFRKLFGFRREDELVKEVRGMVGLLLDFAYRDKELSQKERDRLVKRVDQLVGLLPQKEQEWVRMTMATTGHPIRN